MYVLETAEFVKLYRRKYTLTKDISTLLIIHTIHHTYNLLVTTKYIPSLKTIFVLPPHNKDLILGKVLDRFPSLQSYNNSSKNEINFMLTLV